MHIGILSMQRILNYGSYMQALSLKTMLEELGHKVSFVDYHVEPTIIKREKHQSSHGLIFGLKGFFAQEPKMNPWQKERYSFFEQDFLTLGIQKRRKYRTRVDVLCIGSDEVFNCLQENDKVGYSLELFGKNHRAKKLVSYAASFGNTTLKRMQDYSVDQEIASCLKKFDAISVRDHNSAAIVRELTGREPYEHLDPALVGTLEKMEWTPCQETNFIAVYGYAYRFSEEEGEAITQFAKNHNLRVLILNAQQKFGDQFVPCRPSELFGYFRNAEYIVTDTFHGTIFSVLFHKKVAVLCRDGKDFSYSNENKLVDLIKKLHMEGQLLGKLTDLERVLRNEIDYDLVDSIRLSEREKTIAYLKKL